MVRQLSRFFSVRAQTANNCDVPNKITSLVTENERLILVNVAQILNVKTLEDWYKITTKKFFRNGGSSLLQSEASPSIYHVLKKHYPHHEWDYVEFFRNEQNRIIFPNGFWDSIANQRDYAENYLSKKLRIEKWQDWYKVNTKQIRKVIGGRSLLGKHNLSGFQFLTSVFSEYKWEHTLFHKVRKGYWYEFEHQKSFLEAFKAAHKIERKEDWYNVTSTMIVEYGGKSVLVPFGGKLINMLKLHYPTEEWDDIQFPNRPYKYFDDIKNQRMLIKSLKECFMIQKKEDWYRISSEQVYKVLKINISEGLCKYMRRVYPEEAWPQSHFSTKLKKSNQRILYIAISKLFNQKFILLENYKYDGVFFSSEDYIVEARKPIELDIFVPNLNLAIEYQGEQHYNESYFSGTLDLYQRKDIEKQKLCNNNSLYFVTIPFWWNSLCPSALYFSILPNLLNNLRNDQNYQSYYIKNKLS